MRKFGALLLFFMLVPVFSSAEPVMPQENLMEKIEIRRNNEKIAAFTVEAVSGVMEMQQGLSGRSSIFEGHGMLFILDSTIEHSFWMKGMKFAIDILFFGKGGTLIGILPGLQPCDDCKSYDAPVEAAYALEINAGTAEALGIKKGDRIVFKKRKGTCRCSSHCRFEYEKLSSFRGLPL